MTTEEKPPIRVMLVEDHLMVRVGLAAIINATPGMQVVAEAGSGQIAVDLFRRHHPDITLLDLRMPGMSGVDAIKAVRAESPEARFIVLTTYDGDEDIHRALKAGANGYLLKDMGRNELLDAIRAVHAGYQRIPVRVSRRLANRMPDSDLTPREVEVLTHIAAGKSNREIGAALGIAEATVKIHVNSLLGKLGVSDRTHAAIIALQRGIIQI